MGSGPRPSTRAGADVGRRVPAPAWTARVKNTHLKTPIKSDDGDITSTVSEIVWTGGGIAPRQLPGLHRLLGQLPSGTGQLAFKTLQSYSDGKIVRWIEEQPRSRPEPENPAPTLKLTAATTSDSHPPGAASTASAKAGDSAARALAVGGFVVAVLALIAGGLALTRARRARQ
ncbi:DUF1775 domain-containing protein [Streptomyces sp. NPDC002092]